MVISALEILDEFPKGEQPLFERVLQIRCGIGDVVCRLQKERQWMAADASILFPRTYHIGNLQKGVLLREKIPGFVRGHIGSGSTEGKGICRIFHQGADNRNGNIDIGTVPGFGEQAKRLGIAFKVLQISGHLRGQHTSERVALLDRCVLV